MAHVLSGPHLCLSAAVHATMKSALISLTSERERLKQCLDQEACPPTSPQVVGLKNALTTVNNARSHADTDVSAAARNRCPLCFRLSRSSQMSCPLATLVRSDTLASRLEGLLALLCCLPTCTVFQESWLLPPTQRHFLFFSFARTPSLSCCLLLNFCVPSANTFL